MEHTVFEVLWRVKRAIKSKKYKNKKAEEGKQTIPTTLEVISFFWWPVVENVQISRIGANGQSVKMK